MPPSLKAGFVVLAMAKLEWSSSKEERKVKEAMSRTDEKRRGLKEPPRKPAAHPPSSLPLPHRSIATTLRRKRLYFVSLENCCGEILTWPAHVRLLGLFLDSSSHLYKRACPFTLGMSVCASMSVCLSDQNANISKCDFSGFLFNSVTPYKFTS